jgi:hypothetical protein
MSIVNWYETMPTKFLDILPPNPNKDLHGFNIPFRLCCVAPSGSGKSNWITNLISLFSQGKGTFANVIIICKDKEEPLYKFLASKSEQIQVREGLQNLPNLDTFDKEVASLVIIDDCQNDRDQERVKNLFIRGRKRGISTAYLAQNYYVIPKVIRANCTYLVMLKLSGDRELNMILKENGLGVDKQQLLNLYKYATDTKFSPLIVDIESTDDNKKFRKGFLEYIDPNNF